MLTEGHAAVVLLYTHDVRNAKTISNRLDTYVRDRIAHGSTRPTTTLLPPPSRACEKTIPTIRRPFDLLTANKKGHTIQVPSTTVRVASSFLGAAVSRETEIAAYVRPRRRSSRTSPRDGVATCAQVPTVDGVRRVRVRKPAGRKSARLTVSRRKPDGTARHTLRSRDVVRDLTTTSLPPARTRPSAAASA